MRSRFDSGSYSFSNARTDCFSITDHKNPRDRMVQCVRWYLSAFHAGRRSQVAKKPYNPILGETFQCFYHVPGSEGTEAEGAGELADDGPVPWATKNQVAFIAEQVSHHPPSEWPGNYCNSLMVLLMCVCAGDKWSVGCNEDLTQAIFVN